MPLYAAVTISCAQASSGWEQTTWRYAAVRHQAHVHAHACYALVACAKGAVAAVCVLELGAHNKEANFSESPGTCTCPCMLRQWPVQRMQWQLLV